MKTLKIPALGQLLTPAAVRRHRARGAIGRGGDGSHSLEEAIALARGAFEGSSGPSTDEMTRMNREEERRAEERKFGPAPVTLPRSSHAPVAAPPLEARISPVYRRPDSINPPSVATPALMGAGAVLGSVPSGAPYNVALTDALVLRGDQIAVAKDFWGSVGAFNQLAQLPHPGQGSLFEQDQR